MFKETPATNKSINRRRTVFGVGINDAKYMVAMNIDGKRLLCPFYRKWQNMLQRCYDRIFHLKQPSYAECTVCDEWLTFSNFKGWMKSHDWEDKELDKDLLSQGNKVYSPETCIFITRRINSLMNYGSNTRGKHCRGVTYCKVNKRYFARLHNQEGLKEFLGYYDSEKLAYNAYKKCKYELLALIAENEGEPIKTALLNYRI